MRCEDEAVVAFSRQAWADYQYWVQNDRKVAERVARIVADYVRQPFAGIGNPEPLKHELAGYCSRRITKEHRFVYKVENGRCSVVQCRYHY
ncbi:MAG: Txe/YoeB family addiction module toxin [Gammaproteobacteria bacterium]|nr:Txe/YoeB family addiction module toxin [Gammaproteobacteria bacterium]